MRKYLGLIPHPAIGVRLPDIVVPPVLKAFKTRDVAGTLMLSYHRETAPSEIITSGREILRGHTGTSISEYISKATSYADYYGVVVEVEADHVSLMASPERAIKRIAGGGFEYGLTEEEIRDSLRYIEEEFREVREAGGVDFVTIDTCELIDLRIDEMDKGQVLSLYEDRIESDIRRELEKRYVDKRFYFISDSGNIYVLKYSRLDVARLALKYLESIYYVRKVYDIVKKYLDEHEFGVEVALDEVPVETSPKDLFFYVSELANIGVKVDYIAPNIGFKKREDYDGDLDELSDKIDRLHTIARSLGALLSFHSGSGAHPYSDKGYGVWETIRSTTNGMIKYKVSGVYIQLLLEVMSKFPQGSEPRKLYEEIFDIVLEHVKKYVKEKSGLYSPHLEEMLENYYREIQADPNRKKDPRVDFFRHYFFIFQAVVDEKGKRYLRERVLDLYSRNKELRETYTREAYELTLRIIDKLGFDGNIVYYRLVET